MTADIETALDLCGRALREALGQSAPVVATAAIRTALGDLVRLADRLDGPAAALPEQPGQGDVVPLRSEPTVADGHAITTAFFRIRDAKARSALLALAGHLAE